VFRAEKRMDWLATKTPLKSKYALFNSVLAIRFRNRIRRIRMFFDLPDPDPAPDPAPDPSLFSLSLKKGVWSVAGSGSISQRYGSGSAPNFIDPQHWFKFNQIWSEKKDEMYNCTWVIHAVLSIFWSHSHWKLFKHTALSYRYLKTTLSYLLL
jgi:hypothetical protein